MKAFTDIEQSKKLAEILPIESADMCYRSVVSNLKGTYTYQPYCFISTLKSDIPCWSLAALTNIMRLDYYIVRTLDILTHRFTYSIHAGYFDIETDKYDELIDACVEMILKLHEQNLL